MDEETQEVMADLFAARLSLVNFLHCGLEFPFDIDKCPKEHGDNIWKSFPLRDLKEWRKALRIRIPILKLDDYAKLLLWTLSPYR